MNHSTLAEGYQSFEDGAKPVYERISKLREQIKLNEMYLSNESSESENALRLNCLDEFQSEIKQLEESLARTKELNEKPFVHFFEAHEMTECYLKPKV